MSEYLHLGPPHDPSETVRMGDMFTIAGVYAQVRNPNRKWWQIWKPRMVEVGSLQRFKVTHCG